MTSIIRTLFSKFGDLDRVKDLVTPDARIIGVRAAHYDGLPICGTYYGPEGIVRLVSNLREAFETRLFELDHLFEEGDRGAAFGRFEHRVRTNGRIFRSRWALYCTFRQGKIALYQFHEDTAALEEALDCRTISREEVA